MKRIQDFPTRIKEDDPEYESIKNRFESEYQLHAGDYAFGWTDLNLIRHAELINRLSSIMVTHLDVLNEVEKIKVATKYTTIDDQEVFDQNLPANIDVWEKMVPQYTEVPGWNQSLTDVDEDFEDLPTEAKSFIRILEKISKKNIEYLSINDSKNEGILRIRR